MITLSNLYAYGHRILDIIIPSPCNYCKRVLSSYALLCSDCLRAIKPVVSYTLPITTHYNMTVFAVGAYQDPLKKLILSKNHQDLVVFKQLGSFVADYSSLLALEFDYIIPIPLHWTRYAWRGFNQAQVIAHALGKKHNKPVLNILKRTKRTRFQALLSAEQRHENIKQAFVVRDALVDLTDKKIVLVDDLMTTGSTLVQAAKMLSACKPQSIQAIVIARVV